MVNIEPQTPLAIQVRGSGQPNVSALLGVGPTGEQGEQGEQGIPGPTLPEEQMAELETYIDEAVAAGFATPTVVHVIPVLGQSNASGRGTLYDNGGLDPVSARLFQYGDIGIATYNDVISQAKTPLAMHDTPTGLSFAMPFGLEMLRHLPAQDVVLLASCAHGATGFTLSGNVYFWKTDHTPTSENLYENAITQTQAAVTAAATYFPGATVQIDAILWHQGEADSYTTSSASANYATNLDALIDGLRTRLSVATLPLIVGNLMDSWVTMTGAAAATVQSALTETPSRKTRTAVAVPPTGTVAANQVGDNTHFSAIGQRVFGRSYYAAYLRALANVTGVAPVAPTTPTLVQSGTSLLVTWTPPTCRFTDYVVEYKTAAAGSWTTLSRAASVAPSATITGITPGTTYDVRVSTVNAVGTSAPSSTATIATITAPSQVTGVTAGTATISTQPLTWTANAGGENVTGYLVEYKLHAAGSWTTFGTVTTNAATVTGLAFNSSYDYRFSAINAAGTGTVSTTLTASTASLSFLLTDVAATAAQAYGLRKLKSGYSGSAIRVRYTDATEADIGFTSDLLDTTTLLAGAAAHGGGATVKIWYDQSGNTRNVTNTTAGSQPTIVSSNTLITKNGQPAILFDGTDDILVDATGTPTLYSGGSASMLALMHYVSGNNTFPFAEGNSAGNSQYVPLYCTTANWRETTSRIRNEASTTAAPTGGNTANLLGNTTLKQVSTTDTGSAYSSWVDATSIAAAVAYSRSGTYTLNRFAIGGVQGASASAWANFYVSEVVFFGSPLSTGDRTAGQLNQKTYGATA